MIAEEIKVLMEFVGEAGKGFCRNYGYFLPCSEGIPIPDISRFESYYDRYDLKEWARQQYQSLAVNASACSECEQCLEPLRRVHSGKVENRPSNPTMITALILNPVKLRGSRSSRWAR